MTTVGPADAGDRGRLDIHPGVVRKIVEYTADQVPGTLRHERHLAGIDVGPAGASARVSQAIDDPAALDVRLELDLRYPTPVRSVVDAVRARLTTELDRMTGQRLRTLTVVVAGLRATVPPGRGGTGPRPAAD